MPDWLIILVMILMFGAGWVSHQCYDARLSRRRVPPSYRLPTRRFGNEVYSRTQWLIKDL